MTEPAIELAGDWSSPNLLLRILTTLGGAWQPGPRGLVDEATGAECAVAMRGPDPGLVSTLAERDDPVWLSLTDAVIEAVADHRAILEVTPLPPAEGREALRALLSCGAALVDAGASVVAVRGGSAFAAERWSELAAEADDGDDAVALQRAFVAPLVSDGARWRTTGLAWFGHRDVAIAAAVAETYAYEALGALAHRLISGPGLKGGEQLRLGARATVWQVRAIADDSVASCRNPRGLWCLEAA